MVRSSCSAVRLVDAVLMRKTMERDTLASLIWMLDLGALDFGLFGHLICYKVNMNDIDKEKVSIL